MTADLSVIIPIYNAEDYLRECLDSVVNQTKRELEILLIDDGSTDLSSVICDEYARKDDRIKVIHKTNGGVCDARNVGMENVTTDYFTFMESDDWFPLDACEKMWKKQVETGADFVFGGYYKVATSGVIVKYPLNEELIVYDEKTVISSLLPDVMGLVGERLKNPSNVDSLLTDTAKLYKTKIVRDNELTWVSRKEIYSDCLDFLIRYVACCKSAVYMKEALYYYRRTNVGSQTAGYRANTLDLWKIQFDKMRGFIIENKFYNLWSAYYSRVCFSIIPIGGNAYRTGDKQKALIEIREALDEPIYQEAFLHFKIGKLPLKFRPLFYFAKHKKYRLFYKMTVIMRRIMNKQRGL